MKKYRIFENLTPGRCINCGKKLSGRQSKYDKTACKREHFTKVHMLEFPLCKKDKQGILQHDHSFGKGLLKKVDPPPAEKYTGMVSQPRPPFITTSAGAVTKNFCPNCGIKLT